MQAIPGRRSGGLGIKLLIFVILVAVAVFFLAKYGIIELPFNLPFKLPFG